MAITKKEKMLKAVKYLEMSCRNCEQKTYCRLTREMKPFKGFLTELRETLEKDDFCDELEIKIEGR